MLRLPGLIYLLGIGNAMAAPSPPPTLIYAFSQFAPYKTLDSTGAPAGPYTVLLQELARRSGINLQISECPLQRCLADLRQGNADISIGIRGNDERESYLEFLDPPFAPATPTIVLQRQDDRRVVRRYADLQTLRIGVVEGASYFERFDSDTSLQRDVTPNAVLALRKLVAKRFDVLLMNAGQAGELLRTLRLPVRIANVRFPGERPRRIALARSSPRAQAAKARLSAQLQSMLHDGSVRRILNPRR